MSQDLIIEKVHILLGPLTKVKKIYENLPVLLSTNISTECKKELNKSDVGNIFPFIDDLEDFLSS